MSAAAIDYLPDIYQYVPSQGVSDQASRIRTLFSEVQERWKDSVALGHWREEIRDRLYQACTEALKSNWDGYDAQAVQPASVMKALEFIDALPKNLPTPEIAVDPDGEVSFDWYGGVRRQVSISVSPLGVLSYAGVFGSDYVRGKERLQWLLPHHLLDYVRRVAP
jgi:hypothetical protein